MDVVDVDRVKKDARALAIKIRNARGLHDAANRLPKPSELLITFYPAFVNFLGADTPSYDERFQCLEGQVDRLVQTMNDYSAVLVQTSKRNPESCFYNQRDNALRDIQGFIDTPNRLITLARQDLALFDEIEKQHESTIQFTKSVRKM